MIEGSVDLIEKLCNEVETVNGLCYLGGRLNSGCGCEVAVTARVRIGWVRFRECMWRVVAWKKVSSEDDR